MPAQVLQIISSWISAFGTTIGAIGQTKQLAGRRFIGAQLWMIGKGIQGLGGALLAISEKEQPTKEVGNWLISIGSSTVSVIAARELPNEFVKEIMEKEDWKSNLSRKTVEEIENRQVAIIGASLQSIGAYLTAMKGKASKNIIGGIIQSLGALMEAMGILYDLSSDENTAQQLAVVGGWLQSIGTILQAAGTTEQNTLKGK